ncbi:MAG: HDOD domain-containing protein [Methyloprofundus sp.]|nr:HDOD domain-containing protein [Methyloprofundus sp.]
MNWLTNIFSGKKDHSSPDGEVINYLDCTPPIAEDLGALPYEKIQHLVPLRSLDKQEAAFLPHKILTYAAQSVIFIRQQPAQYVYYLLSGELILQPEGGHNYEIAANSTRAHLPINSGKSFGATAVAKTEIKILLIDADLTKLWTVKSTEALSCVELIDIALPEQLNNSRFFQSFIDAYRENKLMLPSLPDVAFKLKTAMEYDIGIQEAVEILQIDSAIVAKLIQIANSPLYAPITPILNCQDAVARLGLTPTRNLVMGLSLKQLFQCKDKKLMGAMQNLWHRSLYISCLSFVLAEETGTINPDDALLAGLISDIGVIPLLHFAGQYPDEYPEIVQLEEAIPYLRAPVGALVLHTLGFPEELVCIPHHSEDWHYESGDNINLIDIVILAKLHSYFGSQQANHLPYINTIPAYSKLANGKLTPDFSLHVLHRANERVKAIMTIFA